jgi:hypothetical protein
MTKCDPNHSGSHEGANTTTPPVLESSESNAPVEVLVGHPTSSALPQVCASSSSEAIIVDETVQQRSKSFGFPEKDFPAWMEIIGNTVDKSKVVRCKICYKHSLVCARSSYRNILPAIATEKGTRYQKKVVQDHKQSEGHKAALNAEQQETYFNEKSTKNPLVRAVKMIDEHVYKRAIAHFMDVYNDSKRGTLSAWSWPSRTLTKNAAAKLQLREKNAPFESFHPTAEEMQYVNPVQHREFLKYIALEDRQDFVEKLKDSLAIGVKVDGQVDVRIIRVSNYPSSLDFMPIFEN